MITVVGDTKNAIEIAQDFQRAHGIKLTLKRLGFLDDLLKLVDPVGRPQNPLA